MKKMLFFLSFLLLISFVSLPFLVAPVHATTYTYIIHGPYYDDESVATYTNVSCVILWINGAVERFTLANNTGLGANTTTFTSSSPATQLIWSSNPVVNFTRTYNFLDTTTEIVYIHIPSPLVPSYIYTFNVADFVGMINPFLETTIFNGSATNIVERKSLNTTGTVSFVMAEYGTYGLRFRCTRGTFSQTFLAEGIFTINLQVLAGAFPTTTTNMSEASVERTNSTNININYTDPDLATTWVYIAVSHMEGADSIIDYSDNQSAVNSLSVAVTVDNETDYYVEIQAYRYTTITQWDIACPTLSPINPFSGLLDFLGTWPTGLDPAQLVAAGIIMCALGLGSFRSAGISCVLTWIIAGILTAMGWFQISLPLFAFAGVLSVFVVLDEAKSQAREA